MTQLANAGAIPAKPGPNVYTALLVAAIVAMAIALVVAIMHLTSTEGYGLSFGDLFGKVELPR